MKIPSSALFSLACLVSSTAASLRGTKGEGRKQQEALRKLQATSVELYLIDADTDQMLTKINNNANIQLPSSVVNVNIDAIPVGAVSAIDGVRFAFNDDDNYRFEKVAPFAFCGDGKPLGNFRPCDDLVIGGSENPITVKATVESGGVDVASTMATFTMEYAAAVPTDEPLPPPTDEPFSPPTDEPLPPPTDEPLSPPTDEPLPPPTDQPATAPVVPPTSTSAFPWIETFDQSEGTVEDTETTAWMAMRSNGVFEADGAGHLKVKCGGSEAVLTTEALDISEEIAVDVALDLFSYGDLEAKQDYVRLYAKVDDGPEVLLGFKNGVQNVATSITASSIEGNSLILVVRAFVSVCAEYYYLDQLTVSSMGSPPIIPTTKAPTEAPVLVPTEAPILAPTEAPVLAPTEAPVLAPVVLPPTSDNPLWVEDFSLADGMVSDSGPTAWTATRDGIFMVQGEELVINGGGSEAVFTSGAIDISGLSVSISLDVESAGKLESDQDYVMLYAKVDGGAEVLIGEPVYGILSEKTVIQGNAITGNSLVLIIRGYVSAGGEYYFMDNLNVRSTAPDPVTNTPTMSPMMSSPTMVPETSSPTTAPVTSAPTKDSTSFNFDGTWELFEGQDLVPRHEACFVMVGDKAYLLGGRETNDVDIFDPATGQWSKGTTAPKKLHHMQCVDMDGKIYFPSAWTGSFPEEQTVAVMWIYDTDTDTWYSEEAMPLYRRRGSAAVVKEGTNIWVSHGNIGGHEKDEFATSYGFIDYYDTVEKVWHMGDVEGFPDAPNPRDHTGGALIVSGTSRKLCVAGGRLGGVLNWPAVAPTDCFDLETKTWSVEADIPVMRSGAAYGTTCDGHLIVAAGEKGLTGRIDVFNGLKWTTFANELNVARHGTGLAVDCAREKIYIASGSPNGGGGRTDSLEIYTPAATAPVTTSFNFDGTWELFEGQDLVPRHEACFVMVGDKAYLLGGRETNDVDIFDPATGQWSKGTTAPKKLHHMQCVDMDGKIYFPSAWTGSFPEEQTVDVMWIYDTDTDTWYSEEAMPLYRRRGSAAVVKEGTNIWVSHGNIGGHEKDEFATSYGFIDYYDTVEKVWHMGDVEGFPDAPNPRDHTGGALIVSGTSRKLCVAGGRLGGVLNWPAVAPTDCFDLETKTWSVEADIPVMRSGAAYGTTCDGHLIVAAGEKGLTGRIDVFNGSKWTTFANELNVARHGTGLAVDCAREKIYIASGSPNGGGGRTDSLEIYTPV